VAETLFFVGKATNAEGHTGTVHGALATGYRAAAEVAQVLGRGQTRVINAMGAATVLRRRNRI